MAKYRFDQFAATRLYYPVVAYSPDGTQIAHINNTTGQFNLWTVPSGGGFPRQLTVYTDNTVRNLTWSPDGQKLLFQADQNGDEQHQLYMVGAAGGWPEALTSKLDSQHNLGDFAPDGKSVAYSSNARNAADMDVVIRNLETGEEHRPAPLGKLLEPVAWSPNGRYLTAVDIRSNTDLDIVLIDTQTGECLNTTPHEGEQMYFAGPWSPDNSGFYILTNQGREYLGIGFYNIADQKWTWYETPEYDIEQLVISKDGHKFIWAANEKGASKLYGRDLQTGAALNLPDLKLGVIGAMSIAPDGERLAMIFVRPNEASNLYEVDLKTGEMQALGQSMLGGINLDDLVEPEFIEYPTFDGRKIPAWLYKTKGTNGQQVPVILSIHGGPEAQERPTYAYNGLYQYMLSRGFGVLAPNIRGSTGFGITYQKLIHRDWGGDELKDIEHAAKYLQSLDWVDSNRIAVYGGSFGGFATLSAVTRLPDYWALGVDIVGPSNLLTFTKSVPEFWKRIMRSWVGDPDDDRDLLVERSPITYVDQIRVPMLVIQGAHDPRVVKAESDQMVERIRANGGDVRYYVDEEEGHGATRRVNQIKWYRMIAEYIEEYLLDEAVV